MPFVKVASWFGLDTAAGWRVGSLTMPEDFDNFYPILRRAKRDQDSVIWIVAMVTPGLIGGLSQVDKLFSASRFPAVFGYVFGGMECIFLLSIIVGVRAYCQLQLIIHTQETVATNAWLMEQGSHRLDEAMKPPLDDIAKPAREIQRTQALIGDHLTVLTQLHALTKSWTNFPSWQRRLAIWGYTAFIVVLLTSDFSRLVR